jgi:hypothetical protein
MGLKETKHWWVSSHYQEPKQLQSCFIVKNYIIVTSTKIIKTNDKMIGLGLNPKYKIKEQNKKTKAKTKNMKCAIPKHKQIFIVMI